MLVFQPSLKTVAEIGRFLRRPMEEAIWYLETQTDWLGNYEQRQEQGYLMGIGLVDLAVAVVINARMKKPGMRWKRANAKETHRNNLTNFYHHLPLSCAMQALYWSCH